MPPAGAGAVALQRWVDVAMFPDHFPGPPNVTVVGGPPAAEGPQAPPGPLPRGGQGGWGAGGTAVVEM